MSGMTWSDASGGIRGMVGPALRAAGDPEMHLLGLERIPHGFLIFFLVLFLTTWFASQWLHKPFAAVEQFSMHLARRQHLCLFLLASAAIVLRLALLWAIPIPIPTIHDEFGYLLAGDTFAHGRLANPPHPMWVYFDTFHIDWQPAYMSIMPPAQGAALALGQLLGHPWIGVLLSVSGMTGAILWALQGWLPPRWALLGGTLVLLRLAISSYWINSYWGGAVAATGGALVFGALPRVKRSHRTRDAVILGLGVSILANSRPFEGLIFCIPVIAVLVVWLCGPHSPPWRTATRQIVAPFCVVMLLCGYFIGYYNFRLTGHPSLFPHLVNYRNHNAVPFFAWEKAGTPLHFQNPQFEEYYNHWWPAAAWPVGRPDSVMHFAAALRHDIRTFLFFLAYPEMLVPALAAPWILRDRRMRFAILQIVFCFAGFPLVWFFFAHYAAPLTATTFALIVQGMRHLRRWRFREHVVGIGLSRAVVAIALLFSPIHNYLVSPYPSLAYRQRIATELGAMPGTDLIVVRYSQHHLIHQEWVYNAADIDHAKIVWAREIPGISLQPLLNYFPNRRVWIVEPDENPPKLSPYVVQAGANSREHQGGDP